MGYFHKYQRMIWRSLRLLITSLHVWFNCFRFPIIWKYFHIKSSFNGDLEGCSQKNGSYYNETQKILGDGNRRQECSFFGRRVKKLLYRLDLITALNRKIHYLCWLHFVASPNVTSISNLPVKVFKMCMTFSRRGNQVTA